MSATIWNKPEASAEALRDAWLHTGKVKKNELKELI